MKHKEDLRKIKNLFPVKSKGKNKSINKFELSIVKDQLISKSGTLKKKTKDNLKLLDNILKSELLIQKSKKKIQLNNETQVTVGKNNNNYQNVLEPPSSSSSNSVLIINHSNDVKSNNKSSSKTDLQQNQLNAIRSKSRKRKGDSVAESITTDSSSPEQPSKKKRKYDNAKKTGLNKDTGGETVTKCKKNNDVMVAIDKIVKKKSSQSVDKSQLKKIKVHTETSKSLKKLFECDYCNKMYNNKHYLRRHIYDHLKLKPYHCPHCTKKFRHKCNLQVHSVQKHFELTNSPEKFICDLCNNSFLIKENLSLHLSNHTKGIGFYKCAFCDKKFSNHFYLTEHEKNHLKTSKKYECSICKLRYSCRSHLALHVKNHLNIKDFVCQYCGKEFLRPNSIKRHVEVCHSGFRIQCPICCKKLKGHLSEHLRTHENSKPHKCPECGQRFTQSTQLTVHRRSHTGAKPYSCRICGQGFTHSNAMLLHFRRHTGEKPFQCAMCPQLFSQLPHMKAHMKKIHGKTDSYKCQKCHEFFRLKKMLENHTKTCTVGDRELSFEEKLELSIQAPEIDSVMNLSRMRFLLALLLTMVASESKLKCLGFNKRLIDDLLIDSLEAMHRNPCKDTSMSPLKRLKINIDLLLTATIPEDQMKEFKQQNKSTEELLELLTDDKTSCAKIL